MRALAQHVSRFPALYAQQSLAHRSRQTMYLMRPIEEYMDVAGLRNEELHPGRQAVVRFEECRQLMLARKRARTAGFKLTSVQTRLMDEMRNTMVRFWYKNNSEAVRRDLPWLRKTIRYGTQKRVVTETFAARFPRREGKTMVATMVAAITMLSQYDGNVMSLNPRVTQALSCVEQVHEHLELLQGDEIYGYVEKQFSKSELVIQVNPKWMRDDKAVNEYIARGGAADERTAQNLRGAGKRLMLFQFDEFEFAHVAAFVVSIPLARYGAAIVLTSSANARRPAEIGQMLEATFKDGNRIVTMLDYRAKCNECMNKPKPADGSDPVCPHVMSAATSHLATIRQAERAQGLLSAVGDYDIELGNAPQQAKGQAAFRPEDVQATFNLQAPLVRARSFAPPKVLFVTLDPGTISERSVTAIMSFYMTPVIGMGMPRLDHLPMSEQYCVIAGVEEVTVALPSDMAHVLAAHITAVRRLEDLERVPVILAPECNMAYIAESIYATFRTFRDIPNVELYYAPSSGVTQAGGGGGGVIDTTRAGLWTRYKGQLVERMRMMLAGKRIFVHESMVTYTIPDPLFEQRLLERYDNDERAMREAISPSSRTTAEVFVAKRRLDERLTLLAQFSDYKMYEHHRKNATTGEVRTTRVFTGKNTGTKRDDVLSALGVGIAVMFTRETTVPEPTRRH